MAFRIAQFNILGRYMAGTMWFHYAKDFLPQRLALECPEWYQTVRFPRCLMWKPEDGPARFYRFPVLLAEIRAQRADILCLVELDCFGEFREVLDKEGYDSVFHQRPGKQDGCGIFWRRDAFAAPLAAKSLVFKVPANDRIALAQPLRHVATQRALVVVSTHLHWDQEAGHQVAEAEELMAFVREVEESAGADFAGTAVVCGDLNTTPGTRAYEILRRRLRDAATSYAPGSFTSIKPDVYYFAWPRGMKGDPNAQYQWHLQTGRREVIDYVLYDARAFELQVEAKVPCADISPEGKAKPPFGFWAGGWAFAETPAAGYDDHRHDPDWVPRRTQGELQLGIPNRVHGSDHVPVTCGLRFRGVDADGATADEAEEKPAKRPRRDMQDPLSASISARVAALKRLP